MILCWRQCLMKSKVTWLLCPSKIKMRQPPFAFSRVPGSKHLLSHSKPCTSLVHPLLVQENRQPFVNSGDINHSEESFVPRKITSGSIALPSPQMHSMTVTHSCRPGRT